MWLFVAALGLINVVYDLGKNTPAAQDQAMMLIKVLRGEVDIGLPKKTEVKSEEVQTEDEKEAHAQ